MKPARHYSLELASASLGEMSFCWGLLDGDGSEDSVRMHRDGSAASSRQGGHGPTWA